MEDKWIDRYFGIAKAVADWSKDPSTQVGAIAVGEYGQILSQGYNGFPRGFPDKAEYLADREKKYKYIVHAEMNCIYHATLHGISLKGASMYVYGLHICHECAKGIIQSGIKEVYSMDVSKNNVKWLDSFKNTKYLFESTGVKYFQKKGPI